LERVLTELGRPEPRALAASVLSELVGTMVLARTLDDEKAKRVLDSARTTMKCRLDLEDQA